MTYFAWAISNTKVCASCIWLHLISSHRCTKFINVIIWFFMNGASFMFQLLRGDFQVKTYTLFISMCILKNKCFNHYVRPAFCVRSVAPTVLVGSISFLYILSSNLKQYAECELQAKFQNLNFGNFLKLVTMTCLVSTWDLMWSTSMGYHGPAGVSQNAGILVVLVAN